MQLGMIGLGRMGGNIVRRLMRAGHECVVYDRSAEAIKALAAEGAKPAADLQALVAGLTAPRAVWVMLPAGGPTEDTVTALAGLLSPGDIIIDGGNSFYKDDIRRAAALEPKDLHYVDVGTSGGVWGLERGYCMMIGGTKAAVDHLDPIFAALAPGLGTVERTPGRDGRDPRAEKGYIHAGPAGAGHFVKMVHNGIEYADMQLIAESFDLLRHAGGYSPAEIADVFRTWNTGRLDSYLIEITAEVLAHVDQASGKPFVDIVEDAAEQKGTGRWTVQIGLDLGVPISGIAEAVFARSLSGSKPLRAAARGLGGPSASPLSGSALDRFADDVEQALYASKVVAYAQGFNQIQAGATEYGWDIDLGKVASIWRGGCIIRAKFLNDITSAYADEPELPTLLTSGGFRKAVEDAQDSWRSVISTAVQLGIPTPGFSTALAYYDGLRADRLPAALVQGQRDFFGAHTYRRVDREGSFHTAWAADGRPESDA